MKPISGTIRKKMIKELENSNSDTFFYTLNKYPNWKNMLPIEVKIFSFFSNGSINLYIDSNGAIHIKSTNENI